ncbi:MAG: hypothetical protein ACRCUY_03475 [Thermoguttaceae bacterium]
MNLVGKMFIVVIFIVSIIFMALSIVVYTTRTDWKARASVLELESKQRTERLASLEKSHQKEISLFSDEIARRAKTIVALDKKAAELKKEKETWESEVKDRKESLESQLEKLGLSHENLEKLRKDIDKLRENFRSIQNEWAALSTDLVGKTDESHALALRLASLRAVSEQLKKNYEDALDILKKNNLQSESDQ